MFPRIAMAICLLVVFQLAVTPKSSTVLEARPAEGAADAQITEVLTNQQTAWNQGDVGTFMAGYWNSPDLVFAGSNGFSRGWDAVQARYRHSYPDKATMGKLEFSGLEIRPFGERSALVLGHWHLKRTSGDIGGVFTLVFQKFPGGWKIIHDHTSQVLPENP